jgi:dolichol-phosphate mannosyltransferase
LNTPKTLVAIATYNEIDNLPRLVAEVQGQAPDIDLMVIDDNSPDGTGAWCDEQAIENPRLTCLHRPKRMGHGSATVAAMQHAIDEDYDLLITMDADFSHDPNYLPPLLDRMIGPSVEPVDVVIGSRYVPGGGVEGWPWRRRVMSRCVNVLARVAMGLSARDCSGAFRCFRVATLRRIDFRQIRAAGYAFHEEVLWRLERSGARIAEVPIVFRDRTQGVSKLGAREAAASILTMLRLGVKRWLGV